MSRFLSYSALMLLAMAWSCLANATDTAQTAQDIVDTSPTAEAQAVVESEGDGEDGDLAPPLAVPMTLEERFHTAEWVSMVKIESIGALINPTLSQSTNFTVMQAYSYSGSVLKDWKGAQPERIKFRVDLTDCKDALKRDGEYIVFGVINSRGAYQSMSCDDLIAYDQNEALLQTLDKFSLTQVAARP